ncbi:bifunctional protein-disulfide isomerase/oxidoreductase DsbC [Thalassotalea sp. LPB0316]|uniref:bifunctional protein-disulfide isomerase/oxidoreductase DsbC n=1 Tax=Thalassotalea sp. LPB0316 TaxID=2769490 RepID=UPI0018669A47|nr:bifunctional protein-disulfide isomerase/oxidoreductase DsbC [Thalassotalea sp. LPB0316]QOL27038.1 bifunctional protein-disulfide isomerase/oxidoreductase DsbC [Thalassotalea sp. LPB0316]
MFKKLLLGFVSASLLLSFSLMPLSANAALSSQEEQVIKTKIGQKLGLAVSEVKESPMAGLYELITEAGLFYTDKNGDFFLQGKLYGIAGEVINHSETTLAKMRVDGMAKFAENMIVYPAKDEKHVVTVFTDITCTYCRQMHKEMDKYHDLGITIRYLAYPREGIYNRIGEFTNGYKDLRSIWCNENPNKALTKAKDGGGVALRICETSVEDEFYFGRQVGVSGTPAIMLENGTMFSGFRPPQALLQEINKQQ